MQRVRLEKDRRAEKRLPGAGGLVWAVSAMRERGDHHEARHTR